MVDSGLVQYLLEYVTDNKKRKMDAVLENRTRFLTVVLEDIYQAQNASAVVRSCDCFGVQDLHIIENRNKYEINPDVTLGSSKWVNINRYNQEGENNTGRCLQDLKAKGYQIVATTPHDNDQLLTDFNVREKTALVFGTELKGVSSEVLSVADSFVKIPMYGFTESFNISASAAIILFHLTEQLKNSQLNWQLSEEERLEQKYLWIKKIIRNSFLLEKEYMQEKRK